MPRLLGRSRRGRGAGRAGRGRYRPGEPQGRGVDDCWRCGGACRVCDPDDAGEVLMAMRGPVEATEAREGAGAGIPAILDGECSKCRTYYAEGALIRTDGNCGWIGPCCPAETTTEGEAKR